MGLWTEYDFMIQWILAWIQKVVGFLLFSLHKKYSDLVNKLIKTSITAVTDWRADNFTLCSHMIPLNWQLSFLLSDRIQIEVEFNTFLRPFHTF